MKLGYRPFFGVDVRTALITFCVVLLVTLVLAWIRIGMRGPRRGLRDDHEPQLTSSAKHFVADMDSRAQQSGARWQAPGHGPSRGVGEGAGNCEAARESSLSARHEEHGHQRLSRVRPCE